MHDRRRRSAIHPQDALVGLQGGAFRVDQAGADAVDALGQAVHAAHDHAVRCRHRGEELVVEVAGDPDRAGPACRVDAKAHRLVRRDDRAIEGLLHG